MTKGWAIVFAPRSIKTAISLPDDVSELLKDLPAARNGEILRWFRVVDGQARSNLSHHVAKAKRRYHRFRHFWTLERLDLAVERNAGQFEPLFVRFEHHRALDERL